MGINYDVGNESAGHSGDRLGPFSEGFFVISRLIRSRSPIVYVFAVTSLLTFLIASQSMTSDFSVLIRLVASSYLVALATYLYNDLTDYRVDRANQRKTLSRKDSTDKKDVSYYSILYCTIASFAVSGVLAFSIGVMAGVMGVSFAVLAIAYSHPKTRLKDRFVIKTVVTASGGFVISLMGFFAANTYGVYDIHGSLEMLSFPVVISSAVAFLFYFVLGPLGDVGDLYGDKKGGRKTIPIVIGVKKTFWLMYLIVGIIGVMLVLSYLLFGINVVGMVLGIATTVVVIFQIKKVSDKHQFKQKIKTARMTLRYSVFAIQGSLLTGVLFT